MHKLLIVDDEYLMRESLKIIFKEQENISVIEEADSASLSLEKFVAIRPDIVIMDAAIPGADVADLVKYMKGINKYLVILLLKDYGSSHVVPGALEAGADDSLMKPFRPDDILSLVNKYLPELAKEQYIDSLIGRFLEFVFYENYKKARDCGKTVAREAVLSYRYDKKRLRETAELITAGLKRIAVRKQLSVAGKINWSAKAAAMDLFNFESELLGLIEEIFYDLENDKRLLHERKIIQSVLNYIEKNYQNGVTLEEAAAHVHLSPFYLSKLFKKELKVNFVSYVTERKIEKAKELLENTDLPILNIALELNYKEANYFSKVFRKVTGMSPSEYRKKKKKQKQKEQQIFKRNYKILNGNWYV